MKPSGKWQDYFALEKGILLLERIIGELDEYEIPKEKKEALIRTFINDPLAPDFFDRRDHYKIWSIEVRDFNDQEYSIEDYAVPSILALWEYLQTIHNSQWADHIYQYLVRLDEIICPHCKEGRLGLVKGSEPHTIDNFMCSDCDSTYLKEDVEELKNENNNDI